MELRILLEHAACVAGTDAEHLLTLDLPESMPLVQGDPNRVQQVLANLLSNARKYTRSTDASSLPPGRSTEQSRSQSRTKDSESHSRRSRTCSKSSIALMPTIDG
jgi:signal transduction histidine kinase